MMKSSTERRLTRREFLRLSSVTSLGLVLSACASAAPTTVPTVAPTSTPAPTATLLPPTAAPMPTVTPTPTPTGLGALKLLREGYPRAYFFRIAESWASNPKIEFAQWEQSFDRLAGIEGKAFDEEVPGRSTRDIPFFTQFKEKHPDQLVLLHYNGDARLPQYEVSKFFAGHWLYYAGAKILADVPADAGETEIRVANPALFHLNGGNFRKTNDDIGLCELDAQGKPNWNASEQVQLISVDARAGTIRVKRGMYGTAPRAFAANRAYAAPHCVEGPWIESTGFLWLYNFATTCPHDANGKTCADVLVDDLAGKLGAGGAISNFDGVEFDVLYHIHEAAGGRSPDADADGIGDGCIVGGVNVFGNGAVEFLKQLRARLGENRIIQADGYRDSDQRAFGILNGVESEGWPDLRDFEIEDWSGGLNRQSFWIANSREPKFSYINHKFIQPSGTPGQTIDAPIPFSRHRLVFAGAMFTDSAICCSYNPPNEPGQLSTVWDEFWMGTEHKLGWLGMPLGPAAHLAMLQRDLWADAGKTLSDQMLARFQGAGLAFTRDSDGIKIAASDPKATTMNFKLTFPANGADLLLAFAAKAAPHAGNAPEIARMVQMSVGNKSSLAWINSGWFTYLFYRRDLQDANVTVDWVVEAGEPMWLKDLAVYAYPDAMYREFENGLVIANPSRQPFTFDLPTLFPGKTWRRLKGSAAQDAQANDGSRVQGSITLGERDALFLVRA